VEAWLKVDIAVEQVEKFRQVTRGRSSANTTYRKSVQSVPTISCSRDENAISKVEMMDGDLFPLATNTDLDASAGLRAYKYQPKLEKRHALLKSGLQVAPIFLKKNDRIEALMFVYFLAQLVSALIERQLRNAMREPRTKASIPARLRVQNRAMESRIWSAVLCQTKGLGSLLWLLMNFGTREN
jgi:transposase